MASSVTKFWLKTESEAYMTCEVGGRWYFCPTDTEWLSLNGNDDFSRPFATEREALDAAVLWESQND